MCWSYGYGVAEVGLMLDAKALLKELAATTSPPHFLNLLLTNDPFQFTDTTSIDPTLDSAKYI